MIDDCDQIRGFGLGESAGRFWPSDLGSTAGNCFSFFFTERRRVVRSGGGGSPERDRPIEVDGAQAKKDEGLLAKLVVGFSLVLGEQRAPAAIYGDGDHCSSRRWSYTTREGKMEGG